MAGRLESRNHNRVSQHLRLGHLQKQRDAQNRVQQRHRCGHHLPRPQKRPRGRQPDRLAAGAAHLAQRAALDDAVYRSQGEAHPKGHFATNWQGATVE